MQKTMLILSVLVFSPNTAHADPVADFLASDTNNSRTLEGDEFKAFVKRRAVAGNASSKWVVRLGAWGRAWRTVDTNGDAVVTPAELRAFDAKD
jgi:hypothetical protein